MVRAPRRRAIPVAMPGWQAPVTADAEVSAWAEAETDVVEIHGSFHASGPIPVGKIASTGTVLTLVIDAHTGNEEVGLATLGTVSNLQ
jgi:hypothetical protein